MKFQVAHGLNILSLQCSDNCLYLKIKKPVAVIWDDHSGSLGQYFCQLPYSKEEREIITHHIHELVFQDFTGKEEVLYQSLEKFWQLFADGNYSLQFFNNREKEFFGYTTYQSGEEHYYYWNLHFSEVLDVKKSFQNEGDSQLLSTTNHILDGGINFFATEDRHKIDEKRVNEFEQLICAGKRPFALLIGASNGTMGLDEAYFVLDGHHKLIAYQKLGIAPPLAVIKYEPSLEELNSFDLESLVPFLHPWQVQDILDHGYFSKDLLQKQSSVPGSALQSFVKNGLVRTYYPDGQLKTEGNYVLHKPEGIIKGWHPNGQLAFVEEYKDGRSDGCWKTFFENGKLSSEAYYKNGLPVGLSHSYHSNGKKAIEQHYTNGMFTDGVLQRSWHNNGKKSSEMLYDNGKPVLHKTWNEWGDMITLYQVDETGVYRNTIVPENTRYEKQLEKEYRQWDWKQIRYWVGWSLFILLIIGNFICRKH